MLNKHYLTLAIVVVAAYLLWQWWKAHSGRTVADPSNDSALSALFDKLNPQVPGTIPPPNGGSRPM